MNGFYWMYLVIFGLLVADHLVDNKQTKERLYYLACSFLLVLFVAKDSSVSSDVPEYMLQYDIIQTLTLPEFFTHKFEIGYVLMNRMLATLFESERTLFLFMGFLIMIPYALWLEKESDEPMMALMCFVALNYYSHAVVLWRQLCAIGILMHSCRYIRERRIVPFLLVVGAAMLMHKSAAIFILAYLAYLLPVNKWLLIGAGVVCATMTILGQPIMQFINTYIYSYSSASFGFRGGVSMLVILWVFALLVYGFLHHRLKEPKIKLLFMLLLLGCVLQPVCFTFSKWSRVVLFFRIAMVMLIPELYITLVKQGKGLQLLEKWVPGLARMLSPVYYTKGFQLVILTLMFGVLFLWYASDLDGMYYIMAPVFSG